jgi:hypothetical protein
MKALGLLLVCWAILGSAAQAACVVPSYNAFFGIPTGQTEADAFVGKFDYAQSPTEPLPAFMSIDFRSDWKGYLWGALDYAFEGNETVDFDIGQNPARDWYHALWMHPNGSGREFLRGLTKERASSDEQYTEGLMGSFDTWAIGFYNAFGGSTFARVWANPCDPDLSDVRFPVGTVTFKLLFTSATSVQLPYLAGAPSWDADVGRGGDPASRIRPMQLLQIDIAVRDINATETGWVFGSFVYNSAVTATDPWRRLRPVGLSWGNDPTVAPHGALLETVIDPTLKDILFGWDARPELGWGGRMNGPADNLISGCTACHGTAQFPRSDDFDNFPDDPVPASGYAQRLADYFRNIAPGEVFDPTSQLFGSDIDIPAFALDYSLQLQVGLERMCAAAGRKPVPDKPFDTEPMPQVCIPDSYQARLFSTSGTLDEVERQRQIEAVDWSRYQDPIR